MSEFDNLQIRRVDGGLLLVFRELLQRRRASEAADVLGLSPSAVSHALARLRDLFGDPLFLRRSHGLEPTRRALELGPKIDEVIALIGAAVAAAPAFDPRASRRRFRIVGPEDIATLLGPPLVETFRREAPRASFSTRWALLERALRALRRNEADVAIGVFDKLPQGMRAIDLYDDDYCVIARRDHPRVQGKVDLETYARVGHVFVGNPDGGLADEAPVDREAMHANYGAIPGPHLVRTHAYFTLRESAMLLVAQSDVLADCPRRLAQRFAPLLGLQILDPPYPPFRFTIRAVSRAEAPDSGVDWLLEKLAEAFA